MNAKLLLDQFLSSPAGQDISGTLQTAKTKAAGAGVGGIAGGLAVGGVLGVMMGSKKARKKAKKLAGYGGAAALGALAYRAYSNYQTAQISEPGTPQALPARRETDFMPSAAPAADGQPFELALVLAMITAANADGHIGTEEQTVIFERVGQASLDAEDKGFIFDALRNPPGLSDIAALARNLEQATELYLVSRLAIDEDHPMETAYLEALANRLQLPPALVVQLDEQAR